MERFKGKYRIQSNRCKYWNYSSPGFYFVTVCVINRECILGNIHQEKIQLSKYGKIVEKEILKMSKYDNRIQLDEWTIMPNHIHLLIELTNKKTDNGIDNDWNDNGINGNGNVEKIHEFFLPTA